MLLLVVTAEHQHLSGSCKTIFKKRTTSLACLLQDDLPWVEPLEENKSQDEVDEGCGDKEAGQLPAQPGQQVVGLVLLEECPNVVAENQMPFPYIGR